MKNLFKRVLAFLIVLLAVVVLWPLWPSQKYRELSIIVSVRPLPFLAAVYGMLAVADFICDRWKKDCFEQHDGRCSAARLLTKGEGAATNVAKLPQRPTRGY